MMFEVDEDKVVREEMKSMIKSLMKNIQEVDRRGTGFVFSHDKDQDKLTLNKHIDAAHLIYVYYGGKLNDI